MSLSQDLVVIEASGKLRTMYALFDKVGLRATCLATLGHVMESPPHLRPLAIERTAEGYAETHRVSPRPDVVERLSEAVRRLRGRLLIATDDDAEGHAIASDVAAIAYRVRPEIRPLRLRMRELTEAALRTGLATLAPLREDDTAPAKARRIMDRVLAAAYSRPADGLVVGRVVAGLAGLAHAGQFPTHQVTLTIPAVDGGRPFVATGFVHGDIPMVEALEAQAASACPLEPLGAASPSAFALAPTLADYLMAMGEGGRMSVVQATALLQGLYEAGAINYPRTSGRTYAPSSRAAIAREAQARGLRALPVPAVPEQVGPHEALRVLDARWLAAADLNRPMNLQPTARDVALTWISRRMLEAVAGVQRQLGDASRLPESLRSWGWSRDLGQRPPWAVQPRTLVRELTQEQAILQGLREAGIGRPSTYTGHIVRAVERRIVGPGNALADAGRRVLAAIPPSLADPGVASRIERVVEVADHASLAAAVDQALLLATGGNLGALGSIAESLIAEDTDDAHARFVG